MDLLEENIKEILTKVLKQTEKGKVEIGNESDKWTFYVKLLNEESPTNFGEISLKIQDRNKLFKMLKNYLIIAKEFYSKDKDYYDLNEEAFCEKLILDLFVNATNFDLNNFEKFIQQRTEMLKEDLVCEKFVAGEYLNADINVEIVKNFSNLEAPYKFNVEFSDDINKFTLPSVTFGKIKNEVFIYCLQGEKEKQTNSLAKKIDRHMRKLNKGVDETDEILSQVSVSALSALTIFLTYFHSLGVEKVKAYNFMPLRYDSKYITQTLKLEEGEKQEFEEIHNRNQFNITNKFFNTLIRYAYHFNIDFDYDDISEKLEFELKESEQENDNIIYDIKNSVKIGLENTNNNII